MTRNNTRVLAMVCWRSTPNAYTPQCLPASEPACGSFTAMPPAATSLQLARFL